MKRVLMIMLIGVMMIVPVSAQEYSAGFPSYVPISGGAFCTVETVEGEATMVFPRDFMCNTFGFRGPGYEIVNVTNSTVSGDLYSVGHFSYYGNPTVVQCRLSRMNTLEVYAPYDSSYGSVRYQWEPLSITEIKATNMNFIDNTGQDRQNDYYRYDQTDKILILCFCAVCLLGLLMVGRMMWSA